MFASISPGSTPSSRRRIGKRNSLNAKWDRRLGELESAKDLLLVRASTTKREPNPIAQDRQETVIKASGVDDEVDLHGRARSGYGQQDKPRIPFLEAKRRILASANAPLRVCYTAAFSAPLRAKSNLEASKGN